MMAENGGGAWRGIPPKNRRGRRNWSFLVSPSVAAAGARRRRPPPRPGGGTPPPPRTPPAVRPLHAAVGSAFQSARGGCGAAVDEPPAQPGLQRVRAVHPRGPGPKQPPRTGGAGPPRKLVRPARAALSDVG